MTDTALGPDESVTTTDKWVVVWFPPDAPERSRSFDTERVARIFAAKDEIRHWAPLLDHKITTTVVVSELVPLERAEQTGGKVNDEHS